MSTLYQRKRRRLLGPFFWLAVLGLALWAVGFLFFVQMVPKQVGDTWTTTDGIVVLTGGTKRLNTGLSLLSDHKAQKLLISGVYRGVDLKEILALSQTSPKELECCIDIGHEADNTQGNARETLLWVQKRGFKSIRLVTANYHMPRSMLEFSHLMPEIDIIPHPVFPKRVRVDEWWRWPGTASLLIGEYNKYILVRGRQEIMPAVEVSY